MPFWSLYLEDQGFSYQEIGILSSIAIVTRFFAPFIWGWIADKSGKRMLLEYRDWETDRKSTRLNSSHLKLSRMPSSA